MVNKLNLYYKEGDKIKKNDIIAADEKFFSQTQDGNKFNIGSLQKVAVMGGYYTYEDSTIITNKLSREMAADIVMIKEIVLGKNANVENLVKVGDFVRVGDNLLEFENSFDDSSLNDLLASIGDELKESIKSLGKKPISSKYTGEIVDIKIYTDCELEELSPSLRKIVKDYYAKINKKKEVLNKYDSTNDPFKLGMMITEPTSKLDNPDGKIKGHKAKDSVLIEIYIKYRDTMGVGDKLAFFTALKSIVGGVIEEGLEPYSEFRPEEEISTFIAPAAILARMTPSILFTMFANKVVIELERKLKEIYEE